MKTFLPYSAWPASLKWPRLSVPSCVCVCSPAVLLSGVWKRVAGVQGTQGDCVSLYAYECVRVYVWVNEPPLGLNSSLSHQSAHQGSAGDGGQALPAIWSCKRFQGGVCICVCLCVYVILEVGGTHTRPVYPPISIRQIARKFQQSAIEWWWGRGER